MHTTARLRPYIWLFIALATAGALSLCRGYASPYVMPGPHKLVAFNTQFKPAVSGMRLAAVPIIQPGQPVFVTAIGSRGRPVVDVSVMINGMPANSDAEGIAVFTAPESGPLTLALLDSSRKTIWERRYGQAGGKLVASQLNGQSASRLIDSTPVSSNMPSIIYAPMVAAPGQEFLIIGRNFSANPADMQVILDGISLPVLSSSPLSCLAVIPQRTGIGPLKEVFVKIGDEPSTAREVDIANAELIYREKILEPGVTYHGRLQVVGTNFPCLLEVENRFPQLVSLSLPGGNPIPNAVCMMTPGGERNLIPVDISVKEAVPFLVDVRILPDLPGAPGSEDYAGDTNFVSLAKQASFGEITRLKRRLIAIDKRLSSLKNPPANGQADPFADRKIKQEKLLKERRGRLTNMLSNERQLFVILGGSDGEYQKALELANSEAAPNAPNVPLLPLPAQLTPRPQQATPKSQSAL